MSAYKRKRARACKNQIVYFPENKKKKGTNNTKIILPPDIIQEIDSHIKAKENDIEDGGILFYGVPGTGKTAFVKQLAKEKNAELIKVNVFNVKSEFYGKSEENLKDIFEQANKKSKDGKVILFFDEFDAVAPRRTMCRNASADNSVVNSLLPLLDDISSNPRVIVIAATNCLQFLDPAIKRSGRFSLMLHFKPPDQTDREKILKLYFEKDREFDLSLYSDLAIHETLGYRGCDIQNLYVSSKKESYNRQGVFGKITSLDINKALKKVQPSYLRDLVAFEAPKLPPTIIPLLQKDIDDLSTSIENIFPYNESEKIQNPILVVQGEKESGNRSVMFECIKSTKLPIFSLDIDTLNKLIGYDVSTLEKALIYQFDKAKEQEPCFLVISDLDMWISNNTCEMYNLLLHLLRNISVERPICFIASSCLHTIDDGDVFRLSKLEYQKRKTFFTYFFSKTVGVDSITQLATLTNKWSFDQLTKLFYDYCRDRETKYGDDTSCLMTLVEKENKKKNYWFQFW